MRMAACETHTHVSRQEGWIAWRGISSRCVKNGMQHAQQDQDYVGSATW